ncbi:MAG TPA: class F sortase [Actinomycetota bacterium]|jgi:sortase (surface protein transpeptidase)|nr:class F sortase [Actinomycetota bacterium]
MSPGGSRLAVAAAALALLLAGCAGTARQTGSAAGGSLTTGRPPGGPATSQRAAAGADAVRQFRSDRGYAPIPAPVRISIPRIHVSSSLDRLGQAADGTVEVPTQWQVAGWYALGPRPGAAGSAVILGHVDSKSGPAVFFRLRELRVGDVVEIARSDHSTVRFVVRRTAQYPKRRFPTEEVYYPTLAPELRLVTCGGTFDDTTGHYRSNIIVFATVER